MYLCSHMRLKSLYIKGFKSFASDTLIHFNEDVIGIVGPNGSGKSNIVDAIRWVLGEQKSKELRLESMSDIIFNGTKTKKEAPTATVELTFDNNKGILPTEYQTITISRTLYRSGESEYKLNQVVCRLKDINSLFLDTGIGSNSYAIIALGMVDDILADKDQARRKMFEQAAGISKYKIRKKETLSKIKGATEDLNRIDDLLFEIEGNLKSLEKQAKRTQKYLDIKQIYKDKSIIHAILSIRTLKNKYKGLSEQLIKEQDEYRALDTIIYQLQAALEKEKKENTDKELALTSHQKKLNDLVYRLRSIESEKSLLTQKLGFKKSNIEQFKKIITDASEELKQLNVAMMHLDQKIELESSKLLELQNVVQISKVTYETVKSTYATAKMSFDIKQKEKQELEKQWFEAEKQIAIQQNTIDNLKKDIERSNENIQSKNLEFQNIKNHIDLLSSKLKEKESELQSYESQDQHRLDQITKLEIRRDKTQDQINQNNRNIDSKQNEFDLLKGMIDSMEGYPESIKFLNDVWKNRIVLLSDIFDIEERYRAAVELFIEPYLNYFVVNDKSDAIKGINLLKNSQKGRANFILMDSIPQVDFPVYEHPKLLPATNFITCKDTYASLFKYLLGHVYLFDGEIEELENLPSDITVISSQGIYLKQGFNLSGGSVGLFEGKKIGRKQSLEKLENFLVQAHKLKSEQEVEIKNIKDTLQKLKANDFTQTINNIKKTIQSITQDRIKLQHQVDTFQESKNENIEFTKLANKKILESTQKIQELETTIKSLKLRFQNIEDAEGGTDGQIDALGQELSIITEKYNQDNIALIRHQNLLENISKDKEFKILKINDLNSKIQNDNHRILAEDRERIDIEDQLQKHEQNLQELYSEKTIYQSTLSDTEQMFFNTKNKITEIEDQIKNKTKLQAQLQHSIQNLKDKFTEQKFEIQTVGERLRIEFNISINEVINNNIADEIDLDSLTIELENLKGKLLGFGEINPLAVEAYNEIKERYDTIQVQRKDILEAKESLMDTMREIEQTATTHFLTAFNAVRENFIHVFRSLFTEDDTCDLILLDKENPLESDIEIIAKPKGKKPKSLSQLSGGEKTLTATALLFALYLLKPAPFCIFDEVDAPLDDANTQKFNKIINKFSKESQFIIVTHNKSTMAEVKILYGVYMYEQGVSAVSPVDFRNLDHQPILSNLN